MIKAVSTTFARRTNTLLAWSAAVLMAGLGATAGAQTTSTSIYHLYVSTTGSDSNTGSSSSPFKTITKAASVAKPGTTVHVALGTYYGNVSTPTSGTAANRIRYMSDTKWGAKIIGTGTEGMWTNNGNYVDIDGFDITGTGRLGILNYASYTVMSNNHIHNLTVSGGCTGNGGAGIDNANYSGSSGDMIGNIVHDIGTPGSCNGVQGLYSSNNGGKIMNNIVYRVSAYGIQLWHASAGTIIANNTVFANGTSSMGGGIVTGVGDAPGGVQLKDTKVINNIVYANPRASILQYCYSGVSCIGSGNIVANNLVYGNGQNIVMKVGSATGTVSANPLFVSYNPTGTGDYRLQSTSPAINNGTSSWAPTTDMLGAARPSGGAFDIGAYEMGATTSGSTSGSGTTTSTSATWTACANEGGTCNFSGNAQVRYGANGVYVTKTLTGPVACSNTTFGDPTPGVVKSCSYDASATIVTWTNCAAENGTCTFSGTRQVRYGANGQYAYKTFTDSAYCSNSVFGDPDYGVPKTCSYSSITQ